MAAVVAVTEDDEGIRGVATVSSALGRALRKAPAPIRAADLLGHSGDFQAGDFLYVTTRGGDGGQSTLGIGTAAIASAALHDCAADTVAIDGLALLWRDAPEGSGEGGD